MMGVERNAMIWTGRRDSDHFVGLLRRKTTSIKKLECALGVRRAQAEFDTNLDTNSLALDDTSRNAMSLPLRESAELSY